MYGILYGDENNRYIIRKYKKFFVCVGIIYGKKKKRKSRIIYGKKKKKNGGKSPAVVIL